MKLILQKVRSAYADAGDTQLCKIKNGICIYLSFEIGDTKDNIDKFIAVFSKLKLFKDTFGLIGQSLIDVKNEISLMVINCDSLASDLSHYAFKKNAIDEKLKTELFSYFVNELRTLGLNTVHTGAKYIADIIVDCIDSQIYYYGGDSF